MTGMDEAKGFLAALARRSPNGPTACSDWRVRDLVAHLTAGAREEADLVEAALRGEPPRPTRPFVEREASYRDTVYPQLLLELMRQSGRLGRAVEALVRDGGTVEFTGTTLTGRQLRMHSRSELAVHRWDLVGGDATGDRLLARPELTAHAASVLTRMVGLQESVRARAATLAGTATADGVALVLCSPGADDVLVRLDPAPAFELRPPGPTDGVPVVRSSAGDRLLLLWGRRPPGDRVDLSGVPAARRLPVEAFLRS
jgi:uncharacterized protein (TIGR03083 family)